MNEISVKYIKINASDAIRPFMHLCQLIYLINKKHIYLIKDKSIKVNILPQIFAFLRYFI
jgi:hypothetical protein